MTSMLRHITEFTHFRQSQQKGNIINFVKVEFTADLLYWITLDCTGVPNKGAWVYIMFIKLSINVSMLTP